MRTPRDVCKDRMPWCRLVALAGPCRMPILSGRPPPLQTRFGGRGKPWISKGNWKGGRVFRATITTHFFIYQYSIPNLPFPHRSPILSQNGLDPSQFTTFLNFKPFLVTLLLSFCFYGQYSPKTNFLFFFCSFIIGSLYKLKLTSVKNN